jgi:hypothetical protein
VAGGRPPALDAFAGLEHDDRFGNACGSLDETPALIFVKALHVEGNHAGRGIFGQVSQHVQLTDKGLVADAHRQRQPDPLLGELDHLIHQHAAALADDGDRSGIGTHQALSGQEESVEAGRCVDPQAVGPDEGKVGCPCQGDQSLLQICPPAFGKSARNDHGPADIAFDAALEDIRHEFGTGRDHRQVDAGRDIGDVGVDPDPSGTARRGD